MLGGLHLPLGVDSGHQIAALVRDHHIDGYITAGHRLGDRLAQRGDPSPVCADTNSALGNARRSCASARSPAASTLLITNSSGAADAS